MFHLCIFFCIPNIWYLLIPSLLIHEIYITKLCASVDDVAPCDNGPDNDNLTDDGYHVTECKEVDNDLVDNDDTENFAKLDL